MASSDHHRSHGSHHGHHGHRGHPRNRRGMDLPHKSIVAAVAIAVVGGAAWSTYDLFIKPKRELAIERKRLAEQEAARAAEKARDPGQEAYEAAAKLGDGPEARKAWAGFLRNFPSSPQSAGVRARLGPTNAAEFFSPAPSPDKAIHTVVKGDSLFKISKQHGASVDLIARANGLGSTMLQIGQQLVIPSPDFKVTVDREARELILENRGEFFRSYPLRSSQVAGLPAGQSASCAVADTFVDAGGKRVVFGDKRYPGGQKVVVLSPPGGTVSSAPENATTTPPGLTVSDTDLAEIFVLLRRGVPVTIK